MHLQKDILTQISAIREERNTEKRLRMLQNLNDSLPEQLKLSMPSLITNAYVRRALDILEDTTYRLGSQNIARSIA